MDSTTLTRVLTVIPRTSLALLPTPLVAAPRLSAALDGPHIWLKRDDLTGFGFGGNKVRGLEFLVADAMAQGADTIVTGAGPQSNHVRASAVAAQRAGLKIVAVYFGPPSVRVEGNERLTRLLGAEVRYTGDPDRTSVDRGIESAVAELRALGRQPYAIPRGGASPLGVAGYIGATLELAAQCAALDVRPDVIVLAVGSGGTLAGLLAGCKALGLPWQVEGYTVSRPAVEARTRVAALASATAEHLHLPGPVSETDVIVHEGYIGEGYGIPTREGAAAIHLAARMEGVFLDPTYTGKAMAGLIAHIRAGRYSRGETVIFVHTGGEPALFAGDGAWLTV